MNTISRPEPDDAALRRTAAAVGESAPDAALSPAEAADVEATRALAEELRSAYAREPLPFVNAATLVQRATGEPAAGSRRRTGHFGRAISGGRSDGLAWKPFVAVAAAACVALALVAVNRTAPEKVTVAVAEKPREGIAIALPGRTPSLNTLLATMPGLSDAGAAFRPAGRASVALSAPNAKAYAELVRREYAAGRAVAPARLRVDALVNAFVVGQAYAAPGGKPVQLETALVAAPWDATRRVLRVTVRGYGRPGETVATRLAASVDFDAKSVRGWRILGHEGVSGARPAPSIGGGDAVTTLYEIEPVAGVASGAMLASVSLDYSVSGRKNNVVTPVGEDAAVAFERGDSDTRFAVALAAFAMNRMPDAPAALAASAGENTARREFVAAITR